MYRSTSIRLILFLSNLHLIRALWVCDCSICIAEKEIRLCKNIAKFLQNLPIQVAKFCILNAKFEIYFCKKPRGQREIDAIQSAFTCAASSDPA